MPQTPATCASCGFALTPTDQFCGSCGTKVEVVEQGASDAVDSSGTAAHTATTNTNTISLGKPLATLPVAPVTSTATAGAESTPGTTGTPGPGSKKLVLVGAAIIGVLVMVGGGIALGAAISGGQQSNTSYSEPQPGVVDPVVEEESTQSEETTEVEQEQTEANPVNAAPVEFKSQSGNIRCRMAADGVVCHQGEHTYAKPSQACKSGPKGVTVGLDQGGITWPCLSSDISTTYALPYDTIVTAHGYDCIITYLTGVTCTNQDLYGFQMEYDLGIKSVQY